MCCTFVHRQYIISSSKLCWCQMFIVIHALLLYIWQQGYVFETQRFIIFSNIERLQLHSDIMTATKQSFFLLSLSIMAWFSHIMLKVLLFNIVYKEPHFISIEYIYIYIFPPPPNISITSSIDFFHSMFIFTFIAVLFLCILSLLFPELQHDPTGIQTFKYECLYSCYIMNLTVLRL